jgi:hypothetical protein
VIAGSPIAELVEQAVIAGRRGVSRRQAGPDGQFRRVYQQP